jgi:hypothetical protein
MLLAALAALAAATFAQFHTPPGQCDAPRVYHSPFDEAQWGDRVKLTVATKEEPRGERVVSPNKAYWFVFEEAEPAEPHGNVRRLYVHNEREALIEVALFGVDPRYEQDVRWLNEKLIFVQVWWGRIVGVELILDVERAEFIYKEIRHDGTIAFQQWQQQANP